MKILLAGGTGGMGSAIKTELEKNNYKVISIGRNKKNDFIADLSDQKKVKQAFGKIFKTQKDIIVFINSIGWANKPKTIEEIDEKEYGKYMRYNVDTLFYMLKELVPYFRKNNKGLIINISSTSGLTAHPMFPAYSAAKSAVNALVSSTAKLLEKTKVKVINICPGPTNTKMRKKLFGQEDAKTKQSPVIIADLINKIVSGKAKIFNGQQIVIRDSKISDR